MAWIMDEPNLLALFACLTYERVDDSLTVKNDLDQSINFGRVKMRMPPWAS